jgi:hypothetical protein
VQQVQTRFRAYALPASQESDRDPHVWQYKGCTFVFTRSAPESGASVTPSEFSDLLVSLEG